MITVIIIQMYMLKLNISVLLINFLNVSFLTFEQLFIRYINIIQL